jgi:hypothetical protein
MNNIDVCLFGLYLFPTDDMMTSIFRDYLSIYDIMMLVTSHYHHHWWPPSPLQIFCTN